MKRKGRHVTDVEQTLNERATPTPSPTPTPTSNIDSGESTLQRPRERDAPTARKRAGRADAVRPDSVTEDVWSDFAKLRKSKRAPLTQTALDGIQREADKVGWSLNEALRECCERGWQGFKASWIKEQQERDGRNGRHQQKSTSGFGSTVDAAFLAIEDARREGP